MGTLNVINFSKLIELLLSQSRVSRGSIILGPGTDFSWNGYPFSSCPHLGQFLCLCLVLNLRFLWHLLCYIFKASFLVHFMSWAVRQSRYLLLLLPLHGNFIVPIKFWFIFKVFPFSLFGQKNRISNFLCSISLCLLHFT